MLDPVKFDNVEQLSIFLGSISIDKAGWSAIIVDLGFWMNIWLWINVCKNNTDNYELWEKYFK